VRGPKPGPCKPRKRRRKAPGRNNAAKKAKKMARLPWMLATSLEDVSADRVVVMYACRFQCEEMFRDNKSHRFGWSLRHAFCRTPERYDILLTVAMLAALVLRGRPAPGPPQEGRLRASWPEIPRRTNRGTPRLAPVLPGQHRTHPSSGVPCLPRQRPAPKPSAPSNVLARCRPRSAAHQNDHQGACSMND